MKLIHVSDIHIHPEAILGLDPTRNFEACLAHIERFHGDADRIIITGDLTHKGHEASYRWLKARLERSPLKGDRAPRLLIGNHDDRAIFRTVFDQARVDGNGFVQWTEDTDLGRFLYLDTAEKGTHAGHYGAERRAWLDAELDRARQDGVKAWLFQHHNPLPVHVANADKIGIVEEAEFRAILRANNDVIAHVFFGHTHYTLSGVVEGIPYSAPRSTNHTCWPDFDGPAERMGYGPTLAPAYNVCFLEPGNSVIHQIDFLEEDRVLWRWD